MDATRKVSPGSMSILSTTSSLRRSAAAADAFLADRLQEIDLNTPASSTKETLKRWLSTRSVLSTTSSNAIRQEEAAEDEGKQTFDSIGKGRCGEVFDEVGKGKVLKRAHSPQNLELWHDYETHALVKRHLTFTFEVHPGLDLHVPKVYNYITKDRYEWWAENRSKWPRTSLREPTDLLETERILPLPRLVRETLIDHFCPASQKAEAKQDKANRDCLVRVLLGRRRPFKPTYSEGFSLRNFEADLSIIDDLGLEKEQHCKSMAVSLADMHWGCCIDAADVEYVLGTAPAELEPTWGEIKIQAPRTDSSALLNFKRRAVHLWLLDFNHCKPISMNQSGVKAAVSAYWENDPYLPRPQPSGHQDGPLWEIFKRSYLAQSEISANELAKSKDLPEWFLREMEKEARRRAALSQGPPSGGPPRGGFSLPGSPSNLPPVGSPRSGSSLPGTPHHGPPLGKTPQDGSPCGFHAPASSPFSPATGSPVRRGRGLGGRGRGGKPGVIFDIPELG